MSHTSPQRRNWLRRAAVRPAVVAALALLATVPAAQANPPRCASAAEQSMFEVMALKTELMVIGIACRVEERYNEFVLKYRPQLIENDRQMNAHFEQRFGRGNTGKRAMDSFVTNLAQARGFAGQRLGSDYCPRNTQLFTEVMSLPSGNDIAIYAAGKDVIPEDLPGCPTASTASHSTSRSTPARRPSR